MKQLYDEFNNFINDDDRKLFNIAKGKPAPFTVLENSNIDCVIIGDELCLREK